MKNFMEALKLIILNLFQGFYIGVRYMAQEFKIPLVVAWILAIISIPFNILMILVSILLIGGKKTFNIIAKELNLEEEA